MKTLAEIGIRSPSEIRAGTLRRRDLDAFRSVLREVGGGTVLLTGGTECIQAISTGLAAASAAAGTRTALLECELSSPTLATAMGLEPAPGLNEYLRREAEAPQILQPLVLAGPASAAATGPLVCIVAGASSRNGAEALQSGDFRHAVAKLRSAYQLVVLHGPPLGDDSGALDAAASESDALVACVSSALSTGRFGRRVRKTISRLPGKPVGMVTYG